MPFPVFIGQDLDFKEDVIHTFAKAKRYLAPLMRPQKFRDITDSLKGNTEVPGTTSSEPFLSS